MKPLKIIAVTTLILPFVFFLISFQSTEGAIMNDKTGNSDSKIQIVFAAYAEDKTELENTLLLAESVRTFGGKYKDAPIWIYAPDSLMSAHKELIAKLGGYGAQVKSSFAPEESMKYYFSGKTFAAAKAESEAQGKAVILVWMDEDTIVLREPDALNLPAGICLGYRPVMHQLIGSTYSEPPDAFWSRVFEKLSVSDSSFFPVMTVADEITIRPYFNAGLIAVRPERGILRKWVEDFRILYRDTVFLEMTKKEPRIRVFLHQVALSGAILTTVNRNEMLELSGSYNYWMFFKRMFGGLHEFDSIDSAVTLRFHDYFMNPDPEWSQKLKGPAELILWLRDRLDKETK